jgi:hypothetical protein
MQVRPKGLDLPRLQEEDMSTNSTSEIDGGTQGVEGVVSLVLDPEL